MHSSWLRNFALVCFFWLHGINEGMTEWMNGFSTNIAQCKGVSGRKLWHPQQKLNGRVKYKHYSDPNSHQCTTKHIYMLASMFSFAKFWQIGPWPDLFLEDMKRVRPSVIVLRWIFPLMYQRIYDLLRKKKLKRALNVLDSEYIHLYKEPKESGHSLQLLMRTGKHTEWSVLRGRERENVAGNQRERMRKREDGSHCENHF